MPTAFDLHKYTTDYNPIAGGPFVSIQDVMSSFGDVFQEIINLFPQLLKLLEQLTPQQIISIVEMGLTTFLPQLLKEFFPTDGTTSPLITAVVNALGGGSAGGAGNIIPQLISIAVVLIPQLGLQIAQVLTNPGNLLSGFTSGGTSLLAQLIGAGGGSGSTLGAFGNLFGGLGPLSTLFSGFTSGTPLLSQLITAGGGTGSSLSAFGALFSAVGASFAQLISMFSNAVPGLSGLAGLTSIFTDLVGLLGNPTSLGSGAPGLPGISSIPLLGGLFTAGVGLLAGLASGIPIVGQLASALFGLSNTTSLSGLSSAGTNLLSMLGVPNLLPSGTFDPIGSGMSMLQNVLTPAGALSTFTQLPGHLFGLLAPGNLKNALPDPGFSNKSFFDDPTMWDGTIGRTTPLGSLKFVANGAYQQYIGVPIGLDPTQVINVGAYAFWQNLVATTGAVINLAVDAFDINGTLIPNPTGRVVMSVAHPTTNSSSYAGEGTQPPVPAQGTAGWDNQAIPNWVYLSGPYQPPASTSYIAISPEITAQAQSGTVHFDDAYLLPNQGLLNSMILSHFNNLLDGSIPGAKVAGLQGFQQMIDAFQHHIDGLYNSFTPGATAQTGVLFSDLFTIASQMASASINAQSLSAGNRNILINTLNKPGVIGGLQPSGESNFAVHLLPDGTTMPTASLATGNGMAGWVRVMQSVSKGFIDLYAARASGASNIFVNLYKQDTTTGTKTRIWTSGDVSSVFPTTLNWAQVLIPGGVNVNANDVIWAEIYNNSGSAMTVGKRTVPTLDNTNVYPRNVGHTRTNTLGTAPTSLATTDYATSQTAPIFTIGMANVPAGYHVPEQQSYPPAGSGAGNYLFTIPTWAVAGDTIDLIGVGGGGSGMSEWNAGVMAGGLGGSWNAQRFVLYSDPNSTGLTVIPTGTTQLQCAVGAGGPHPGGYWANGNPGSATVWTCYDGPSAGTVLLTCAGGAGGSGSVGLSSGQGSAPTPNPYTFQGMSYTGGSNVGINATGAKPGGGGGGATWYELGGSGAPGGGWTNTKKAGT